MGRLGIGLVSLLSVEARGGRASARLVLLLLRGLSGDRDSCCGSRLLSGRCLAFGVSLGRHLGRWSLLLASCDCERSSAVASAMLKPAQASGNGLTSEWRGNTSRGVLCSGAQDAGERS